jgi:membrane complex biogenesis BtpA family protein
LILIGMIHLPPLPNAPLYSGENIEYYIEYAINEAEKLVKAGFDGFIIENYMDYPFSIRVNDPVKLSFLELIASTLRNKYRDKLVGLNILRNSGLESLSIACRNDLDFIRVNSFLETVIAPEGLLKPLAHELINYKYNNKCLTKIFADINVKHSKPLMDYVMVLKNTCTRGLVDGVIVTGEETGGFTPPAKVFIAKRICGGKKIIVGSGVNHENIGLYIGLADALIIGTNIKVAGVTTNPIDYDRALKLSKRLRILEKRMRRKIA